MIGATGKLGRALMKKPNTIPCPIRFEDADKFEQWFEENKDVDTVWYVARACRKTGVRRSIDTFMLEQNAKRIVSTACVRGTVELFMHLLK